MRLINRTAIPDRIIHYFLHDLGISKADWALTVELGDCSGLGVCRVSPTRRTCVIVLSEISLWTLAHELKHLEQHVSGLSDWMKAERELTPYLKRWHEVEARRYARAWKGRTI